MKKNKKNQTILYILVSWSCPWSCLSFAPKRLGRQASGRKYPTPSEERSEKPPCHNAHFNYLVHSKHPENTSRWRRHRLKKLSLEGTQQRVLDPVIAAANAPVPTTAPASDSAPIPATATARAPATHQSDVATVTRQSHSHSAPLALVQVQVAETSSSYTTTHNDKTTTLKKLPRKDFFSPAQPLTHTRTSTKKLPRGHKTTPGTPASVRVSVSIRRAQHST